MHDTDPADLPDIDPTRLDLAALRLPPDAHKGTRGAVGIIGGAPGMVGAAWLAGRAALHGGAGRVYVGQLDPAAPAVDPLYPELMLRRAETLLAGWVSAAGASDPPDPERLPLTALVVGPGMGSAPSAAELLAQAIEAPLPLLLDADALNLLARRADLADRLRARGVNRPSAPLARAAATDIAAAAAVARPSAAATLAPAIITPHPAEAARLLRQTPEQVQADRSAAARALAERFCAVVVLKGAGTLVAWPSAGDTDASDAPPASATARRAAAAAVTVVRNPTGSARLATAGTGDVLSGLIGALLARGLAAPTAAQLGVWVHGRAGEQLPDERPTASGLLAALRGVLEATAVG